MLVKTISLKRTSPVYIMWQLGLCTEEDAATDTAVVWKSPHASPTRVDINKYMHFPVRNMDSKLIPAGIEQVLARQRGNGLTVRGEKASIDELRAIAHKLDVQTQNVMIDAEFYEIDPETAKELSVKYASQTTETGEGATLGFVNDRTLDALRSRLSELGIKPAGAPTVTTPNEMPTMLSVQTSEKDKAPKTGYELLVNPRINSADNSITLSMQAGATRTADDNATQRQALLTATCRVASGESLVIVRSPKEPGKGLLLIVKAATAK
jgi:type II secretory pathway component GspD/PulD (secretin)